MWHIGVKLKRNIMKKIKNIKNYFVSGGFNSPVVDDVGSGKTLEEGLG